MPTELAMVSSLTVQVTDCVINTHKHRIYKDSHDVLRARIRQRNVSIRGLLDKKSYQQKREEREWERYRERGGKVEGGRCVCVCLSFCLRLCLSVCLSLVPCLSVCLSVCLSLSLSLSHTHTHTHTHSLSLSLYIYIWRMLGCVEVCMGERERERERRGGCWLVGCLTSQQHYCMYLRGGSAQTFYVLPH